MTDTDLIREARDMVFDAFTDRLRVYDLITRLAAALEERGKQSSDRFDRARQAEASARHWEERTLALAAEQERDRLREVVSRVIHELQTYDPRADEYKGKHIHKVWARELDTALARQTAKGPKP